jgi:ATP-GRASP peptide maturase of grasp-with-spasm system
MIVIISKEVDESTNDVIRHCILNQIPFIRFSEENFVNSVYIQLSNEKIEIKLLIGDSILDFDEITSFWFRKNDLLLFENVKICTELTIDKRKIHDFISDSELKSLKDFLIYSLQKKKTLGNYAVGDGNKLISFSIAAEVGLNIPKSIISSDTQFLLQFANSKQIVKPLEDGFYASSTDEYSYTEYKLLNKEILADKDEFLFPSCLQEYIEKKIELRIFYIDGKIFSMAIFSQLDPKTKLDFRNYNFEKMNRMLPYKLPDQVEEKVILFMKKMCLNTGSIDMILTNDNEYVFLEVNPVGQYGMVQYFGNYNLDLEVFNYLAK